MLLLEWVRRLGQVQVQVQLGAVAVSLALEPALRLWPR